MSLSSLVSGKNIGRNERRDCAGGLVDRWWMAGGRVNDVGLRLCRWSFQQHIGWIILPVAVFIFSLFSVVVVVMVDIMVSRGFLFWGRVFSSGKVLLLFGGGGLAAHRGLGRLQ